MVLNWYENPLLVVLPKDSDSIINNELIQKVEKIINYGRTLV
jgi:hypothetical protein